MTRPRDTPIAKTLSGSHNWWAHQGSPGRILCHAGWSSANDFKVVIDHADPLIWIGAELVSWAATGQAVPRVTFTPSPGHYWIGSVIRFHADNRDVLYRLTSWHGSLTAWSPENIDRLDLGYYVAEWPD